jgi:hypothetical protein
MARLEAANLIRVFDFYLAMMLLISLMRRYQLYWDAIRVLFSIHGRWPRLLDRIRENHTVLVTPVVLRALLITFSLMSVQMILSRLIWPTATLRVGELFDLPIRLAIFLLAAIPMLMVDAYFIIRVGRFDRNGTETYLDQAEYWLASWKAPVIHAVTLGYISPRQIVDLEVRKGLAELGESVRWVSKWVSIQVSCRVLCGLTIWILWAVS